MHDVDVKNQEGPVANGAGELVPERVDCNEQQCGGADCGSCIVERELAYSWSGA